MSVVERIAAFEKNFATIESPALGLSRGSLADLDEAIASLPREQLAIRTVAVLTGLFADLDAGLRNVSESMAGGIGGDAGAAISNALRHDQRSIFVEPMQQLIVLRRCLTNGGHGGPDVWSDEGLRLYFDACRFAADVAVVETDKHAAESSGEPANLGIVIAASFLLRMSLLNPPHVTNWIARMRLMLHDLPKQEEGAKVWAERLEARIVSAFGLTFDEVARLVGMLTLWSLRFKNIKEAFKPGAGIALNIDTWLSKTHLTKEQMLKFFGRTARPTSETLSDNSMGGPLSILPFRDRPFLQFDDGTYAPVYPPLVAEKLTYDLFWWAGTTDTKQERPWQRDWGDLVELYVVKLLAEIAKFTGCEFKADVRWDDKQIDAAMWLKGHVALFEISAGMMTDAAAHSGDPAKLREGLYQTLVRSKSGGKDKNEAVGQMGRDVRALLAGELKEHIPVENVTAVYPVVIAIDRRVRVPGLRFWFDKVFADELVGVAHLRVGPLAVLELEDLETVEQFIRADPRVLRGTPRGFIRLLRLWALTRDNLPSGIKASAWFQFMREFGDVGVNERLKAESDRWWDEVKAIFKRDEATPTESDEKDDAPTPRSRFVDSP